MCLKNAADTELGDNVNSVNTSSWRRFDVTLTMLLSLLYVY